MKLNNITLEGRLTLDPVNKNKGESKLSAIRLAYEFGYDSEKKEAKVGFIDVLLTGYNADYSNNNLKKGYRVIVMGKLAISKYKSKDGKEVEKEVVFADFVECLEKKVETENGNK